MQNTNIFSLLFSLFLIPILLTCIVKYTKKNYFINYIIYFLLIILFYFYFIKNFPDQGINSFLVYSNIFPVFTVVLDYIIAFGIYLSRYKKELDSLQKIRIQDIIIFVFIYLSCTHSPIILYQSNLLYNLISKELFDLYKNIEYSKILESYRYIINSPEFWIVQLEITLSCLLLIKIVLLIYKNISNKKFKLNIKVKVFILLLLIILSVTLFYYTEYYSSKSKFSKHKINKLPQYYFDLLLDGKIVYKFYFIVIYLIYTFFATCNEEIFFRFILIDELRMKYPELKSIIITIILWSISHIGFFFRHNINIIYLFYVFIVGILLTLIRIKKNSIILNVSIHYIINLINIFILFYLR